MSRKSIEPGVLKPVVSEAAPLFTTKDISDDERVRSAYPELAAHRNYCAFVGGALSDHHLELGIEKVRPKGERGMQWRKKGRRAT
jgi:hypothetical protein